MQADTKFSRVTKLILTSPYFLLIFLVIPIYTIISLKLHLPVSGNLLLFNNVCFLVCIAVRFVRYALRIRTDIRYGADYRPSKNELALRLSPSQLRTKLSDAGYRFDVDGGYGEKRDAGYLGTTAIYGGMLLLLLFGSYDYLREYSIMVRIGTGEPMSLDGKGLAGEIEAGGLAATSRLPLLQVKKQILPNTQWPKGATEIALLSSDRKELATGTVAPGKPFNYHGLDFHMTKFVFDAMIIIRDGKFIVYDGFVKLLPLPVKKGDYSYYGGIVNKESGASLGGAWLNPEKKAVRVDAKLGGKQIIDANLELWGKNRITQGNYAASLEGIAHWTEIRVARGRHRVMLTIGAVIAVLGAIVRVAVRPQRVWLEEAEGGCRARATGGKTLRLLQDEH